jgi:hypothetical protein
LPTDDATKLTGIGDKLVWIDRTKGSVPTVIRRAYLPY